MLASFKVSIIVPTYNESKNLPILVRKIAHELAGTSFEIVVVDDDSPDGTWLVAESLSSEYPIRVIRRMSKRGLSSAIVDGFANSSSPLLAVIDADLQHDTAILPALIDALADHEIAIATRYSQGGGTGNWNSSRLALSKITTVGVMFLLGVSTSDPMSGFFAIRKDVFESMHSLLRPRGYKTLIEILYRGKITKIHEVSYVFSPRLHGESKLEARVLMDCAGAIWDLRFGDRISFSFIKYCMVGLLGVGVQLLATHLLRMNHFFRTADSRLATIIAILCAIFFNYTLDNMWTFRESRHRGASKQLQGILLFLMVCSTGAMISWSVAQGVMSLSHGKTNIYFSSLIGISIATFWNYVINRKITWKESF